MIKAVIFDLDGVLVSTDEMHYQAWKRLADELGITRFTRQDNERQRGVSRMESLDVVLEKGDCKYSQEEKHILADKKNGYYVELLKELDETAVLSGVINTLIMLRKRGILIGVGSASKNTPMILEKTGLVKYIDKVSCGLDVTKSKPDPEVFLVAAQKLRIAADECLVVEDSKAGIIAAKRGGMHCLGVGQSYQSLGADYEAKNLADDINWEQILAH